MIATKLPTSRMLTTHYLQKDYTSSKIGCWFIKTKTKDKFITYLIVKDKVGYTLAQANPLSVIESKKSFNDIVKIFNEQLVEGQTILHV